MTSSKLLRDRLYEAYASHHACYNDGEAAALIYRRDIRPPLPPPGAGPVLDIGCGQGQLVRLMIADGYDAEGIDVSPEQVGLAQAAGLDRIRQGDYRDLLDERRIISHRGDGDLPPRGAPLGGGDQDIFDFGGAAHRLVPFIFAGL